MSALIQIAVPDSFKPFNATEKPLAYESTSYWSSMARASSPAAFRYPTSPDWPVANKTGDTFQRMVLQEGNSTSMTASFVEDTPGAYVNRCMVSPNFPTTVISKLRQPYAVLDQRR